MARNCRTGVVLLLAGCAADFPEGGWFDWDGDGFGTLSDCNDANPLIRPGVAETCNGRDDDCDGLIDGLDPQVEGSVFYFDADGDGFGSVVGEGTVAGAGAWVVACELPAGYAGNPDDCDDTRPEVHPGAVEQCAPAELDEDCDGDPFSGAAGTEGRLEGWVDADGDGFGDPAAYYHACVISDGLVGNGDDCNDASSSIHPAADEWCNGTDDDCDGAVDESENGYVRGGETAFLDRDGDGYGDAGEAVIVCEGAAGVSPTSDDCDETDAAVHPGAPDACGDGLDQDCDGLAGLCFPGSSGRVIDVDGYGVFVSGTVAAGALGNALSVGDTDGDGLIEAWASQPGAGGGRGGAVRIAGRIGSGTPDELGLTTVDSLAATHLGETLLAGADLDGDGVDDLVIGTTSGAGAVYLLADPGDGSSEADAFGSWAGVGATGGFGSALAAGDFDGDGHEDLFASDGANGRVLGRFGPIPAGAADSAASDVSADASAWVTPALADLDGDGAAELLLGEYADSRVRVFEGGAGASLAAGSEAATFGGRLDGSGLGFSLTAGGDINGDGYGDVAAGAPWADGAAGRVEWFAGPPHATPVGGAYAGASRWWWGYLGASVSFAGDMDGDACDEVFAGAPGMQGERTERSAVLVLAKCGAWDDPNTSPAAALDAPNEGRRLGLTVAAADLDGDGFMDLITGGGDWLTPDDAGSMAVVYGLAP